MDKDPYSAEFLIDPYPFHEELREAGPVVWLEAYDISAAGRHEHVRADKPVARIEGVAVPGALVRGVGCIGSAGEPRRHLNNPIRSFESLPVTFYAP